MRNARTHPPKSASFLVGCSDWLAVFEKSSLSLFLSSTKKRTENLAELFICFEGVQVHSIVHRGEETFIDEAPLIVFSFKLKVGRKYSDSLLVEGSDQWDKISVTGDKHRNVDFTIKSDLQGVDSKSNIGSFLSLFLGHWQVLGFDSGVHQVMIKMSVKLELLWCCLLDGEEPLMPRRIDDLVARVSLFLVTDESLKEKMKRLKAEPSKFALVVVIV